MRLDALRTRGATALLFALILGGAGVLGFIPYRLEVRAARREVQRKVLAVGRLKAGEITHWLQERREDVLGAATGPQIALDVERWSARGRIEPDRLEWVKGRVDRVRTLGGYMDVAVTGLDGDEVIVSGRGGHLRGLRRDDVRRAVATDTVVVSPIARPGGRSDPTIILDVIAPLTAVDARGSRVVGALVFRVDPRVYLFPLVQSWPTDSPSAESVLVERQGEALACLNDLRHRSDTALTLVETAGAPDRVAAKVLGGASGVVEGVDYRGVAVLAWVEAVEGSPWLLISKIDQAEIYAPLRDYLRIYLAFLVLAAITAGATTLVRHRGIREALLRREHDATVRYVAALEAAEKEREQLIGSLTRALDDVKTLRGIVPICASCKRVRDDTGYWKQVEAYVSEHTEAQFSHGVCPECARRLYGELATTPAPGRQDP